MSLGAIAGAVVGGVVGFFVGGGPIGAVYGATLGFSLGMAIDPMTPDIPTPGAPDPGELVMTCTVGAPIPDLAGTTKITGYLLCYGNERSEAIFSETSGGGGKGSAPEPEPQIVGYKYFMSWVVGIAVGPADVLYAIYKDGDIEWEGSLDCPASGGKETIVLPMGSVDFYFGTSDQAANSKVAGIISDPTFNTPYRNMCWAFFDDCFIGKFNRAPTMKFIIKKLPEYSFSTKNEILLYDCNPAHCLWYILHDLAGLPESWLHSTNFASVAEALYNEYRGISILFDRQQSALNYVENINSHIDNILRYGIDGKFHPKLIRDDYVVGTLLHIDEDVMLEEPTFSRKSWIDTINEVKVQYSEIIEVERIKCTTDAAIQYATLQMSVGEEQTLRVDINGLATTGIVYEWKKGGGGSLSAEEGFSVVYTAPSENPNCQSNGIIQLYCVGKLCDEITIAVNEWTPQDDVALLKNFGCHDEGVPSYDHCSIGNYHCCTYKKLNCFGDFIGYYWWSTGGDCCELECDFRALCDSHPLWIDVRTEEMKEGGCCLQELFEM